MAKVLGLGLQEQMIGTPFGGGGGSVVEKPIEETKPEEKGMQDEEL